MRLKGAREDRGLSQSDLAERAGFQPSAVSHFETGRRAPSFENLKRLADALGVSTDFLLGRMDQPTGSGPVAKQIFRDLGNMSPADQEAVAAMAAALAKRNRQRSGEASVD